MKLIRTAIPDVIAFEPRIFSDQRGFFLESFRLSWLEEALGQKFEFVQDNHSRSYQGVLRGLHYQLEKPQGKWVSVTRGEVYDVAVDLRKASPTFGKWVGVTLSEMNGRTIFIPEGFAHGFLTLSPVADVLYKTTDYYHPASEKIVRWDDPDLAIEWPLSNTPLLSEKDREGAFLKEAAYYGIT